MRNKLVTNEELMSTKAKYTGNFVMSLENPATIAGFARNIITQDLPENYYNSFLENINNVTKQDVKNAAQKYFSPNKTRILCVKNSFHGRTLATIFASGSKKMTEGFGYVGGFDHFVFGDHKSLKKKITKNTAAIMVETIMGEGGIKVIPDWCLRDLRKLCNKKKILLILDEVQCGIGRSGKFFAFEHAKIKPDIVPIAKGIGGGFPIGAVLVNKKVASGMKPGTHGSTFGGNPLAMSAGNAVMDVMFKKGFLSNVAQNGKYFLSELNKLKEKYPKIIKEVRGKGLLLGLCLYKDQTIFIKKQLFQPFEIELGRDVTVKFRK